MKRLLAMTLSVITFLTVSMFGLAHLGAVDHVLGGDDSLLEVTLIPTGRVPSAFAYDAVDGDPTGAADQTEEANGTPVVAEDDEPSDAATNDGLAPTLGNDPLLTSASTRVGAQAWFDAGNVADGVHIAVIDEGYGRFDEVLPGVQVDGRIDHCDQGFDASVHGTATAEVIHDVAPSATLTLVCVDDALDLKLAVDALLERDIDIVNMSLGFYNSSRGDGNGAPGSPDDSARRAMAGGMVWVNAAGNEALNHYASGFTDVDGDGRHEFEPKDELMAFKVPPLGTVQMMLKWDDWPLTDMDVDICVTEDATRAPDCYGMEQAGDRPPTEQIKVRNPTEEYLTVYLTLHRKSGTGDPRLDLFLLGARDLEYPVAHGSVAEPASVPGVISVGSYCPATQKVHDYSSQGPTLAAGSGVTLVAPEPVATKVFGSPEGCFGGYGGTSAAAPHVAGSIALIHAQNPEQSVQWAADELIARSARSSDPGAPGPDSVFGFGPMFLGTPGVVGSPSDFRLVLSNDADRSDPIDLDGQVLSGDEYVSLSPVRPEQEIVRVDFKVGGRLMQVEREWGYDLGGGRRELGYAFDTTRVDNGTHLVEAEIDLADGTSETVVATVEIENAGVAERVLELMVWNTEVRDGGRLLEGSVLEGSVWIGATPDLIDLPVDHVKFYVDAELVGYDSTAPYNLGRILAGQVQPLDIGSLEGGEHTVQVVAELSTGEQYAATSTFTVGELNVLLKPAVVD